MSCTERPRIGASELTRMLAEIEAIIAELLEPGASEDGEFIAMIRDRFVMRK